MRTTGPARPPRAHIVVLYSSVYHCPISLGLGLCLCPSVSLCLHLSLSARPSLSRSLRLHTICLTLTLSSALLCSYRGTVRRVALEVIPSTKTGQTVQSLALDTTPILRGRTKAYGTLHLVASYLFDPLAKTCSAK